MTSGEIFAASKAAEVVGKKVLGEDKKTKDVLLSVAEDSQEMKVAARAMAARVAVKEQIKLKLFQPLARLFGVRSDYFDNVFERDIAEKMAKVPVDNIITPAPSIAVPAIQGLAYSCEEPSLKNLYLNLLAAASDDRRADQAHPAFAEIIKQLTPREALLLNLVLKEKGMPIVNLMDDFATDREMLLGLMTHVLPITDPDTGLPREEPQAPTWVENWERLGLVSVSFDMESGSYDWVKARPEYVRLAASPDVKNIVFNKGYIEDTFFGRQFFRAVTE